MPEMVVRPVTTVDPAGWLVAEEERRMGKRWPGD